MEDIIYGILNTGAGGWISEDNGQHVSRRCLDMTCSHWQCQKWEGDTPMAPLLVLQCQGNKALRVCPKCGASYGFETPRRIDEKTGKPVYDSIRSK